MIRGNFPVQFVIGSSPRGVMRRGIFWFTLVKSPTSAHSVTWPLPDKALWLNTLKGDISKLHYLSKQHEFANIFLYHTIEMFTDVFPLCLHLSFVVCTKKNPKYSSLQLYLLQLEPIRLDVGEYACPVCHKVFKTSSRVRRHVLIHTGEKPYDCPDCNYKTNQRGHLQLHIQNQHPHIQNLHC